MARREGETADERVLRLAAKGGWIGVDLDGTLAFYEDWMGWNVFGDPILLMQRRVRHWLAQDVEVRIFTARVGHDDEVVHECRVTGERFTNEMMAKAIQDWTEKHCGARLTVTCFKDVHMIEYWDDRAVQVVPNTGRTIAEEHAAQLAALEGKP